MIGGATGIRVGSGLSSGLGSAVTTRSATIVTTSSATVSCDWFAWTDEVSMPRIFVSSKRDYKVKISSQSLLKLSVRDQLLMHKIARKGYLQVGRFVPCIESSSLAKEMCQSTGSPGSSGCGSAGSSISITSRLLLLSSGEWIDLDSIYSGKSSPSVSEGTKVARSYKELFEQVAQSDLMFAVITEAGQYQVVAEAHHALSLGIPVFLKFCNCDQYDVWSYRFLIDAIRLTSMTDRTRSTSSEIDWSKCGATHGNATPMSPLFRTVDVLSYSWVSEKDYLEYLETIPICNFCHASFSRSRLTEVCGSEIVTLDEGIDPDIDAAEGGLQIESVEWICSDCRSSLVGSIRKALGTSTPISTPASAPISTSKLTSTSAPISTSSAKITPASISIPTPKATVAANNHSAIATASKDKPLSVILDYLGVM